MTKLFKYLKQSWVAILTILILLALQATTELSLPTYTSNIVNVGIQQSGIENATIKAIRESEMDKLTTFMSDSDKNKVLDNYKLINKDNLSEDEFNKYKDDYPAIKDESLYILNTKDKETIEKLSDILAKPMLLVYNIENSSEGNKLSDSMTSKLAPSANQTNMDPSQMAKFMDKDGKFDIFAYINAMPNDAKEDILSQIDKQFVNLPETMLYQRAITFVKAEYKAMGVDLDSLQMNYIFMTGLKMIGLTVISVICSVTVGFMAARVAATLGKNLRAMTFKKVMNFSKKEISEFSTASLITRSTNDIQQIQQMMVMMLRMVFFAPFMAIGGIIKALSTNLSMSWIIALGVVCVFGIVLVMFTVVMPRFKKLQNLVDRLNLVTREILTGLGVIRAFSNEKFEEDRFDVANQDLTKVNMFVNRMMSCMMPAMMLIMNLISILIVWVGAKNIDLGNMQVGDMMAFIQYTMQIVKNVSFKYPDADEKILHDISFIAKPGQTTAFIGSTGSGKSTLINLIPRFYDVTEGEIKVDGINIKNASIHDLREKIGYVPQKGVLFSGTIESNIKYGNKNAGEDLVETASRVAQATEFIDSKPDRYETPISQGGSNVSGGQKQRLSIARAIAKEPEIYIFDDSFSALDFKTDAKLRKALKEETGDATVLIVAQRISTILHAEQIVVLDEGKVVGIGNHKQLLKNCEVYKEIALSQLSKEELENE